MTADITVLDRAAVLTPFERFDSGRIVIRAGIIEAAGPSSDIPLPPEACVVDLHGHVVVPGFIDPHIHGAAGADVMDASYEALNTISRFIASAGVTTFLPTTISSNLERTHTKVEALGTLISTRQFDGAQPAGIHLEGPFINPLKRGAHPVEHLLPPDVESVAMLRQWVRSSGGSIRLVTFAPEFDGAGRIIEEARASGFALAMGHSNASESEAAKAVASGVRYATHTFNAMRPFTHRDPGITGVILTDDRVYAELIADGIHVSPAAVRVFARCKPRDRVLLVTDATAGAGMPDGRYTLGGEIVDIRNGACRNAEGQLAGSALRLDEGLRNYRKWTGLALQDAIFSVTANPASALGLKDRGAIALGMRADFAVLDHDDQVAATFVAGRMVFSPVPL